MFRKFFLNRSYRTGAIYGSASTLSNLVTMMAGVMMIRWIEPSELGIWQSLAIIQLYIPFLEAGVSNGLNRELPFHYGKGNIKIANSLAQTSKAYLIWVAIFLFLVSIITGLYLLAIKTPMQVTAGVFTVGLLASINTYQRYLTVTFRSSEAFLALSKVYIYASLIQALVFPIVAFLHYYGLLIYSLTVAASLTIFMHYNRPLRIQASFNLPNFKLLIKTGIPVFLMGYLRGISNTFTRLILLWKGGTLSVGLFTPAGAVGTLVAILPGVLGNYFFPKMNYRLGQTNDPKLLWPMVLKINFVIFIVGIPFALIVWFGAPIIMNKFFQNYTESNTAIQFFSLNFLVAGTLTSHNVIYAIKKYKLGYIFLAVEFCLRFSLPYIFVNFLDGNILTLTAIAILITNIILFILNIILIRIALYEGNPIHSKVENI